MDVENILHTLNQNGVEYVLIGGMNFQFNHSGPSTDDVDIFIDDTPANRVELNYALKELQCGCAGTNKPQPLADDPEWLANQPVSRLNSPFGAIDVFRSVRGLEDGFAACKARAELRSMPNGEFYYSLSDEDMLRAEEALGPERNMARLEALKKIIAMKGNQ